MLETGEYIRVGGQKIMKTDVRIVAATNVNIRKAISEGRFREDLYYRLNTIPIQMPPLRERGEDILLLFRLFAMQMAEAYHLPKITLTDDAKAMMLKYKWPGNVRQLKNITEQMSVLSEAREINTEVLKKFIPQDIESTELAPIASSGSYSYAQEREVLYNILYELKKNVSDLRRDISNVRRQLNEVRGLSGETGFSNSIPTLTNIDSSLASLTDKTELIEPSTPIHSNTIEEAEAEEIDEPKTLNLNDLGRQMVEKALERNEGNRKKAAKELGISDRTLYRRIKQYGLDNE